MDSEQRLQHWLDIERQFPRQFYRVDVVNAKMALLPDYAGVDARLLKSFMEKLTSPCGLAEWMRQGIHRWHPPDAELGLKIRFCLTDMAMSPLTPHAALKMANSPVKWAQQTRMDAYVHPYIL